VPKLNALQDKYAKDGLVVLAIHSDANVEKGKAAAIQQGMKYPVAFDNQQLMKQLGCDSFPDYVLVDRKGLIRVNDLSNAEIEKAVQALLAEK
jgi:peroxiredoxin